MYFQKCYVQKLATTVTTAAKCSDAVFETGLTFGLPVHKIINICQYREACGSTTACRDDGEPENWHHVALFH